MEKIIETIVSNLQKNGFPSKKVSFPKASLESFIRKQDYELEDVLGEMRQDDIFSVIKGEKVIFSSEEMTQEKEAFDFSNMDLSALKNMDPKTLKERADEMMKNLPPEELEKYRKMFENMSAEEKSKLFDQARQMGLY